MPTRFFITHSWKDIDFARRLCDDLSTHGLDGFLDAHSISPGDSIPLRIERGLTECDVYIPVFSPDALKSDWCDWEIDMAITMNRTLKGRPRIIPVIAKPCRVPNRLIHLLRIDFVGRRYDDAFRELLTKGFDLPEARPAPSAPPENPVAPRQVAWQNWLLGVGAVVTLTILFLIVARSVFVAPSPTPTPPSVAGLTLATLTIPPTRTNTQVPTVAPSPTPAFRIGSTKTAKDGSLMMFVPAGEFLMGSSDADKNTSSNENPQHTVYLDEFWIGKYEVTNALYKKCVDAGKCSVPKYWENGAIPAGKENHPVNGVTWSDASAYAQWMGGRLPTEAEWEKAACWDEAKKVKRVFPWGDLFDVQKAHTFESGIGDTTPVGKYSPQGDSPYGVSDMAGNVLEWVADWYSGTYYSNSLKNNPKGPDSGTSRVLRGGSWPYDQRDARCAVRYCDYPVIWGRIIGFRVVVSSSSDF